MSTAFWLIVIYIISTLVTDIFIEFSTSYVQMQEVWEISPQWLLNVWFTGFISGITPRSDQSISSN